MLRFLLFLMAFGSAVAADLEIFQLADGRTFIGTYDESSEKLNTKVGSIAVSLSVPAQDIVSRTPYLSPDDNALEKQIQEREANERQKEQDESRAKWAVDAQARINARREKEARDKAEIVAKMEAHKAALAAEKQKKIDEQRTKEEAVQRAAFWKERGIDFDPQVLSAGQMDDLVQAKIDKEESEHEKKKDIERAERARKEEEQRRREEELEVKKALDAITRSIAVELIELNIDVGDKPIYIGMDQGKVAELINPNNSGRQRETQWCWAACVQMICAAQGIKYDQENVVKVAMGMKINVGGTILDFLNALSEEGTQENGQPIQLQPKFTQKYADVMNDLDKKLPLIGAFVVPGEKFGHAMVITGMNLVYNKQILDYEKSHVCLFDPWPGSPPYQEMSLMNCLLLMDYAVRMRVTRW